MTTSAVVPVGEPDEHHEPGLALDQRGDRGCWRSPMSRSPSQWPGTARSSTSAGRSLIVTIVDDLALAVEPRAAARPAGRVGRVRR